MQGQSLHFQLSAIAPPFGQQSWASHHHRLAWPSTRLPNFAKTDCTVQSEQLFLAEEEEEEEEEKNSQFQDSAKLCTINQRKHAVVTGYILLAQELPLSVAGIEPAAFGSLCRRSII